MARKTQKGKPVCDPRDLALKVLYDNLNNATQIIERLDALNIYPTSKMYMRSALVSTQKFLKP